MLTPGVDEADDSVLHSEMARRRSGDLKGEPHDGVTDGSSIDDGVRGLLAFVKDSFSLSIFSKAELETGVEGSRWRVGRGIPR